MRIQVIGAGCADCTKLYDNTVEALSLLGLDAEPEKVEDLLEIVRLGVMSAPSLMVDGKLLVSGRVAGAGQIAKLLERARGAK